MTKVCSSSGDGVGKGVEEGVAVDGTRLGVSVTVGKSGVEVSVGVTDVGFETGDAFVLVGAEVRIKVGAGDAVEVGEAIQLVNHTNKTKNQI